VRDPYETLGVAPEASADEIKKAYRRLAKRFHPDTTGGDKAKEERFKEISTAYDILGDASKRKQYDTMRQSGFAGIPGAEGGGPGVGFDLGELFAQMFGGGGAPPGRAGARARGGPGVEYRVYSSGGPGFSGFPGFGGFEEEVPRPRRRRAPEPTAPTERAVQAADGSRLVLRGADVHSDVHLTIDQAILGTVAEVATLSGKASVKIPPGTSSGVKLRLKGKGGRGAGGEVGDHFVTVQIDVPRAVDDEAKRLLVQFMQRTRRSP
jgi:DnaJ-class molecular chaperone